MGRREIVCLFHGPGIFSWPQPDRQSVSMNVNAVDHLCDGAVTCDGRGGHPALVSEMLAEGFDDDVLDIGCRNAGNRSDLGRLGLAVQAPQ